MIDIAIAGAGHWGPNLIRLFDSRQRSRVRVVADLDEARLSQVADRFEGIRTTTSAVEALTHPAVDAVVIATPTTTHFELARVALEAGKHVFIEKPISADLAQSRWLCTLAEERRLTLMIGHVFLFNPAVIAVKRELERETLGPLNYLSMERTNLGPVRADVNAAWDLASHDISIANYWLEATPESVSAVGESWINPGVQDAVFATLRYPGAVLVNLHSSWLHPVKSRRVTVVGAQRMLTFDDLNTEAPVRIFDKGVGEEHRPVPFPESFASFRASIREGGETVLDVVPGEPLAAEVDHFLTSVETGKKPLSDGRFGAGVVAVLEAFDRSLVAGGSPEPVAASAWEPANA